MENLNNNWNENIENKPAESPETPTPPVQPNYQEPTTQPFYHEPPTQPFYQEPPVQPTHMNQNQNPNMNPYSYQEPQRGYNNYNGGYNPPPQYSYIPNIPGNPEPPRRKKREKRSNGNGWKIGTALLCIVCLCGSIFGGIYWSTTLKNNNAGGSFGFPGSKQPEEEASKDVEDLQNASYETIADIAEDVGKSVVTIVTTVETETSGFYGSNYSSEALGSGVIIGEEGDELYIATNYHVIADASAVSVLIGVSETEAIDAYYKGSDSTMDLAVIYVKKSEISEETLKNIKIATLGESDELKLGDLAIAIGSPIDKSYSNTVTTGIISGLERNVTFTNDDGTSQTLVLLQTDAAINPGNSGGALVNGRGEVIGINNAKIVASDVEGMGFALPMSTIKPILVELINNGKVIRPYLGITGSAVESGSEFATYYNLLNGIYIVSVEENGPASRAGIQPDDVLITFNGVSLMTFEDLTTALAACEIGQVVEIELIRGYANGEPQTITVQLTVAEKPGDFE